MDLLERAGKYVGSMAASVSGAGGHNAAFKAACVLVNGFGLSEEDALAVMRSDFNPRCDPAWSERELVHKVAQAQKANHEKPHGHLAKGAKSDAGSSSRKRSNPAPVADPVAKRQAFDAGALSRMVSGGSELAADAFICRSPVQPVGLSPFEFMESLYRPGEKVLIFNNEMSQGQYGVVMDEDGKGRAYRLGNRAGVKPERVEKLPQGGPVGLWFLAQPVDGKWSPNGSRDGDGNEKLSRRSAPNVTAWRYLVLESDEAKEADWLRLLYTLPLPVAAIYYSGGKSVHALLEVNAASKGEWDALRDKISPVLSKLGADPAAMTAVRLTRVPNVWRYGSRGRDGKDVRFEKPQLQSLIYLNPRPVIRPVGEMPRVRKIAKVEN